MKSKIAKCKGILVNYLQKVEYDFDAIEYLVDSMDYLLQEKIPCKPAVLEILIEDVLIASTYHKSKDLLEVAALLRLVEEEASTCMK